MTRPFFLRNASSKPASPTRDGIRAVPQSADGAPVWQVEINLLERDGETATLRRMIPAHPVFEAAFGGFARGTLLQTETGPVAIEDLLPGDAVMTTEGRSEPVQWIGRLRYAPSANLQRRPLARLQPDAFGPERPATIVNLGPSARILCAPADRPDAFSAGSVVTPILSFVDGDTVVEALPPTEVQLFHLSLRHHAAVLASGLPVETYHPGRHPLRDVPQDLRPRFVALFPHLNTLADFGPMRYARADAEPHRRA
jgi:hypothetical protein